ncbi:hypothetical protein ABK905_13070 [Acerihabitans sp. KWT182]|uniref:Uncharacterized protein n=1 Tax=Acerihabitans sp. KWT182 TaxID=3157919 RepID=A0AAU7QGG7_9GAMM
MQNEHVAYFLQKAGFLAVGDEQNVGLAINQIIACLSKPMPPSFLSELARSILAATGLFGAQEGEGLSVTHQLGRVHAWIAANLFGDAPEGFLMTVLLNEKRGRNGRKPRRHVPLARLNKRVKGQLASFTELSSAAGDYIFKEILLPAMPTLGIRPDTSDRQGNRVGSLQWVYLHAGAQFAHDMGLGFETLPRQALLSLGIALEAMLLSDPACAGIIHFFIRPASIYSLMNKLVNGKLVDDPGFFTDPDVRQHAVEQFFADSRLRNERNNPFIRYSRAIEGYRTRTQLAQKILRERCDLRATGYYAVDTEGYKNSYDGYACRAVGSGPVPVIELLPNVSKEFRKQNQRIAKLYQTVDMLLLTQVFTTLSAEESLFLQKNEIKLATAEFSSFEQFRGRLGRTTFPEATTPSRYCRKSRSSQAAARKEFMPWNGGARVTG